MKVRVVKVAVESWAIGAWRVLSLWSPMKSWMSWKWKGDKLLVDAVYSLGHRRKKNARVIMSAMATWKGWLLAWATIVMWRWS